MRVTGSHHLTAVLKYLHVADDVLRPKVTILIRPLVDDDLDIIGLHSRKRQAVVRRETEHATDAALAFCNDQTIIVDLAVRRIRLQCREVVIKYKCRFVIRIFAIAGSLVRRTQITRRIVTWRDLSVRFFLLPLPRTFCTVRRNDEPLARSEERR